MHCSTNVLFYNQQRTNQKQLYDILYLNPTKNIIFSPRTSDIYNLHCCPKCKYSSTGMYKLYELCKLN